MHKSKNSCSCNISEESAAATAAAIRPSALLLASSASLAPNGNAPEPACRSHGWNGIELGMHSLNATTRPEMSLVYTCPNQSGIGKSLKPEAFVAFVL